MALIKCNECGKMVSDKASACPNCGAPVEKKLLCEDCGNEIPAGATACPTCGCPIIQNQTNHDAQNVSDNYQEDYVYDFDPDEESDNTKRKLIWIIAGLVLAAGALGFYFLNESGYFNNDTEEEVVEEDATPEVEEVISGEDQQQAIIDGITTWFYGQTEDDLTHDITSYTATIESKNECQFDTHGNTARLVMQLVYSSMYLSHPSTAVLLSFDDGKTDLCRYADSFSSGFKVVFDNGEVDTRWSLIDNTSKRDVIFMYMPSKVKPFLAELRSHKTCRIQVNLDHVGMTTFDFNIEGLKWDFDKDDSARAERSSTRVEAAEEVVPDAAAEVKDAAYEAADETK